MRSIPIAGLGLNPGRPNPGRLNPGRANPDGLNPDGLNPRRLAASPAPAPTGALRRDI